MGIMIIVGFAGEKRTKIRYDTCLRCFWKLCCKNKKNVCLVWRRRAIWDKERKRKMLICLLLFSRRKRSPAASIFLLFSRLLFVIIVCVIYIYTIYIVRPQKNWENQMGVVRVSCICVRKTCIARNTTGENLSLLLPVSLSERSFLERVCVYVCVCVYMRRLKSRGMMWSLRSEVRDISLCFDIYPNSNVPQMSLKLSATRP